MASRDGYEHGTHVPGRGWYDDSTHCWVDRPDQVTRVSVGDSAPRRPMDGVEFRDTPISTAEAVAKAGAEFVPQQHMEDLRRLRDTNPADYTKMPARHKISVGSYEEQLRHHLRTNGGDLPPGVRPLPNDAA